MRREEKRRDQRRAEEKKKTIGEESTERKADKYSYKCVPGLVTHGMQHHLSDKHRTQQK